MPPHLSTMEQHRNSILSNVQNWYFFKIIVWYVYHRLAYFWDFYFWAKFRIFIKWLLFEWLYIELLNIFKCFITLKIHNLWSDTEAVQGYGPRGSMGLFLMPCWSLLTWSSCVLSPKESLVITFLYLLVYSNYSFLNLVLHHYHFYKGST